MASIDIETQINYFITQLKHPHAENISPNNPLHAFFAKQFKENQIKTITTLKQILKILDNEWTDDESFEINLHMLSNSFFPEIAKFAQESFSLFQRLVFVNDLRLTKNGITEAVDDITSNLEDLDLSNEEKILHRKAITQANEAKILLDRIEKDRPILLSEYKKLSETTITEVVDFLAKHDCTQFIQKKSQTRYFNRKKPWEHLSIAIRCKLI